MALAGVSDPWNGTPVLVTGAGGFIGSHLTERLVRLGARVRAFVHYNALDTHGWLDGSPLAGEVDIVSGDIADAESVRAAVNGSTIVFHLAALIAIPYSYRAPRSYVRTNIEGTLNVCAAAREFDVARVVHTSTSEVYGSAQYVPIDERHPLVGQSPYAATKIGADKIAEAYASSFGVRTVTIRPFNTFGPRQSARAVVPAIITQCLTGGAVRLGNVRPTRDLNFVANTVDGFVAAAGADGVVGETINLGSGREISIGDLAALIGRLTEREIHIARDAERLRPDASEVERLLADNDKARRLLNWTPAVTLENGLAQTIEWMSEHLDRYRPGVYVV